VRQQLDLGSCFFQRIGQDGQAGGADGVAEDASGQADVCAEFRRAAALSLSISERLAAPQAPEAARRRRGTARPAEPVDAALPGASYTSTEGEATAEAARPASAGAGPGETDVLSLHRLELDQVAALLMVVPGLVDMTRPWRLAYCEERGVLGFAVEQDGEFVGFALAESGPQAVHVVAVEGGRETCRLLVERLVRLAGERAVTAACPEGKDEFREALEGRGFSMLHAEGSHAQVVLFYRLGSD
jgi:hypothetical protein